MYMVEMGDWKVAEVSSNSSDEEVGPAEEGEVPDYAEHAYYRDELSDEILRKEYEVGASSSKPHIDTPKMQQLLNNKIEKKVEDLVKAQVLNLEQATELEKVLKEFKAAFAFKEAKCEFNNLTPMRVEINPSSSTFVSKPYPVKKLILEELKKKIQELTDMGMIYREPNPFFSSPVMMLPKPRKPTEYRMVVDLRKVNKNCLPTGLGLPDLEAQLGWLKGNECWFGSFDGLSVFDYLKMEETSYKYFGMVTPLGTYCMRMAPQGFRNTPQVYQERLVNEVLTNSEGDSIFGAGALQWLDDTLLYHNSFAGYLQLLGTFLKNCIQKKFKLNLDKCDLIQSKTKWCGRILEKGHWKYDSSYFAKIIKLPRPQTLGQLQDVVYVSTCLSDSLPNLSKNKGHLNTRMREIEENIKLEKGKKMRKDARKKVDIEKWWREEDQVEFQKFLQIIEGCQEKKLKTFEADGQMGIFTDASDKYWSSVLASFSGDGWEPIFFVSGEFTQSSRFWSITDKEIYPIIRTLRRYRFLLINVTRKIKIFTDHMNVKHLMSSPRDLKQSSFGRIQRWILTVQEFDVEVYHIGGQYNVLADLLTRWGYLGSTAGTETEIMPTTDDYNWTLTWKGITFLVREKDIELEKKKIVNIRKEKGQSFVGLIENKQEGWRFDPKYVSFIKARVGRNFPKNKTKWKDLSVKELLNLQKQDKIKSTAHVNSSEDGLYRNKAGEILIHPQHVERFLVLAHQISKHGSVEEVVRILNKYKFQGLNKSDVRMLVSKLKRLCLHCDKDLKLERRIYKEIPHAVDSSELLLHSDFMKVYSGYLLVLVEDISRKVLMIYDPSPSAHVVVKGLVRWRAEHGMPSRFKLSTDNGSHFCNQIVSEFNSIYGGQHHFSVVYSPWSNGSIEVMNRYILRYLRQLCSEYNLDRDQWYELVDLVTDVINNTPTRKGFTPNELTSIFGRKNEMVAEPARELKPFPLINSANKIVFPKDPARFIDLCHKLLSEIENRRTKIFPIIVEDRRRKREYVNRKFKSSQVQFAPGDFVLMSNIGTQRAQGKLHLRWLGPYIVTDILGTTTYRVKSIDGKNYVAHAQRISLYEAQPTDFRISDQVKAAFYYNQGVYEVHKLLDIRKSLGGFEALVWWKGFPRKDANWQDLQLLFEDVPRVVQKYLNQHQNDHEDFTSAYNIYKRKSTVVEETEVNLLREATQLRSSDWLTEAWKIIKYPPQLKLLNDQVYPGLSRSKGWNSYEKDTLQYCIYVFGLGKWEPILKEGYLPGKTRSQLVEYVKVAIGSQRLYEFHGLKISLRIVKAYNDKKRSVFRRKCVIINNGVQLTREELKKIRKKTWSDLHQYQKFGKKKEEIPLLSVEQISNCQLSIEDISKIVKLFKNQDRKEIDVLEVEANHSRSSVLKIIFGNNKYNVLLDSGAWQSCVGKNLVGGLTIYKNDELHKKAPRCKGVSGAQIDIIGYIKIHCCLKGEGISLELPDTHFYVLSCNTNKFILGNNWLKKMKISPLELLKNRSQSELEIVSELKRVEVVTALDKWEEFLEKEKSKVVERRRYRSKLSNLLENDPEGFEWSIFGSPVDSYFTIKYKREDMFKDLVLWRQPVGSKLKIGDVRCQDLTSFGRFGVLMIDPPWENQASSSPTRGLTIKYPTLADKELFNISFGELVEDGIVGLWVTNNKIDVGRKLMSNQGFRLVEYVI
eukprot:snap_masked-scaffold_87-processed-gene-0.0-mRNA-1 protein AED:0.48 eAED:0.48 QI:0/-1/0/1/-1/1/1/0/1690